MSDLRECVTGTRWFVSRMGPACRLQNLWATEPEVWAVDERQRLTRGPLGQGLEGWQTASIQSPARQRPVNASDLQASRAHGIWMEDGRHAGRRGIDSLSRDGCRNLQSRREWPDHWLVLLGHLVGDGSYVVHQPLRYTTGSQENSDAVRAAAEAFGCRVSRHEGVGAWHQLVISGNGNRWHPAGVGKWLKGLGIFGQRSHQKRLPVEVFSLADRQLALLLRHLWATDGTVVPRKLGQRGGHGVNFSTCSAATCERRGGFTAKTGYRRPNPDRAYSRTIDRCTTWTLVALRRSVSLRRPSAVLGLELRRLPHCRNALPQPVQTPTWIRCLPKCLLPCVPKCTQQGISQRAMAQMRGTSYGGSSHFRFSPSREQLASYAELLESPDLAQWASSDLFWDRVVTCEAVRKRSTT